MARPRAVLPASSSSSSSDCATGAPAGATFADDAGASAEKIDCDTSERSTEARFWLFENLEQTKNKGTSAQSARRAECRFFLFHSRLSSVQLCQFGPDRVHPTLRCFPDVRTSESHSTERVDSRNRRRDRANTRPLPRTRVRALACERLERIRELNLRIARAPP
jgi:hypothetical protein